jgi:peptide deformylase
LRPHESCGPRCMRWMVISLSSRTSRHEGEGCLSVEDMRCDIDHIPI